MKAVIFLNGEYDYKDNFLKKIGDKEIDIVCGGPPCQSFSLAGKRKKFDKKEVLKNLNFTFEKGKIMCPKGLTIKKID